MRKTKYDITKDAYDKVASGYAENAYKQLAMRPYISEFIKGLPLNGIILDLGCGTGHDSFLFNELGYKTIGVDFSSEMIKEAKKRVPESEFFVEDMRNLNFPKNKFDGIWFVGSLHHLPHEEAKKLFLKLYDFMNINSKGFISTQMGEGERFRVHKQVGVGTLTKKFWAFWQPDSLKEALEKVGFVVDNLNVTEAEQRKKVLKGRMKKEKWLTISFHKS